MVIFRMESTKKNHCNNLDLTMCSTNNNTIQYIQEKVCCVVVKIELYSKWQTSVRYKESGSKLDKAGIHKLLSAEIRLPSVVYCQCFTDATMLTPKLSCHLWGIINVGTTDAARLTLKLGWHLWGIVDALLMSQG